MEETSPADSELVLEDENNFLHLTNEGFNSENLHSRVLISKLWKLSLFYLYGGSEIQREWLKEALSTIHAYLFIDGEGEDIEKSIRDINEHKYINSEEFLERSEALYSTFEDNEIILENIQVIAKGLVALAVQKGTYDARYRTTIRSIAKASHTDWDKIDEFEKSLVEKLTSIKAEEEERAKQLKSEQDKKNIKRAFLIGLTAVGGGAILALSAGLAAPLIGAGAVAVLGSGSAAIFTGTSGVAIIASIFGAAGAGLTGFKMTKRIGKIEQFEFASLSNTPHLHVTLAISGFCGSEDDSGFSAPWQALDSSTEQYSLIWEGKYLRLLGSSIVDFVKREAMQAAVKEILRYTALRAVLKSIAWPLTLISAANIIDNPWNVCTQRSKEAGYQLAHVLINRHQGYRPVTLIGFSLGARVIFYCLQRMLTEKEYQGIVEDVILMGAPVGVIKSEWEALEAVVSGTLYNCYSRSDWLLKFVYRAASIQVGDIAGLGPIELSWPRMKNIDLGEIIKSHSDYAEPAVISDILDLVNVKTKPVEQSSPKAGLKNPQEIVKQISKTPKEILSQAPIFSSKDDSTPQPNLTPEEHETVERLSSCKNSNIGENFPKWRNKDTSDDCDGNLGHAEHGSPFKRVMSLQKRFGFAGKACTAITIEAADNGEETAGDSEDDLSQTYGAEILHDWESRDNDTGITMKMNQSDDSPAVDGESNSLAVHHGRLRRHSTGQDVMDKIKNSLGRNEAVEKSEPSFFDDKNTKCKELFKSSKQAAVSIFSRHSSPRKLSSKSDPPSLKRSETVDSRRGSLGTHLGIFSDKKGKKSPGLEVKGTGFFDKLRRNIDSTQSSAFARLSRNNSYEDKKEINDNQVEESSPDQDLIDTNVIQRSREKKHSAP